MSNDWRVLRMFRPLRAHDFRLLWMGDVVSLLGDQFYLVALPWLVLTLKGAGLAVGTTLMLAAIPRAVLLLVGGVASDRRSPRHIVIAAAAARGVFVGLVAWLAWTTTITLAVVYALVFLFGVADAFAYPAFSTLVPLVVEPGDLPAANGLLQGAGYATSLVGPALGGALIATAGLAPAFGLDSVSFFVLGALMVWLREPPRQAVGLAVPRHAAHAGLTRDVLDGVRAAWDDRTLRIIVLLIAAVNVAFAGPYTVGLSVLAKRAFGGPAALGAMFSAMGGGALIGAVGGGAFGRALPPTLRLAAPCAVFGVAFVLLPFAPALRFAAALTCALGIAGGFINVLLVSWLQLRAPAHLLGRMMSLVLFASIGLQPVSYAAAALLVDRHLTAMFLVSGSFMLAATAWAAATGALADVEAKPSAMAFP